MFHPSSQQAAPPQQQQLRARRLLAVLVGLPGAGKTTAAAHLAATGATHDVTVHHLCLDALLAGSTSFSSDAWQACRQQLVQQAEQLLQQQHAGEQLELVLVDDNNQYQSMRQQLLRLARTHGAAFLQVHVQCSLDLALARNAARSGAARVPEAVLRHCASQFEPPDASKRPWKGQHTLTLQQADLPAPPQDGSSSQGSGRLWELLLRSWGAPVPPLSSADAAAAAAERAAATAANLASRVHQADLASRAMLHAVLSGMRSKDAATGAARLLNERRKVLLQQLRTHQQQHVPGSSECMDDDDAGGAVVEQLLQGFEHACLRIAAAADGAAVG